MNWTIYYRLPRHSKLRMIRKSFSLCRFVLLTQGEPSINTEYISTDDCPELKRNQCSPCQPLNETLLSFALSERLAHFFFLKLLPAEMNPTVCHPLAHLLLGTPLAPVFSPFCVQLTCEQLEDLLPPLVGLNQLEPVEFGFLEQFPQMFSGKSARVQGDPCDQGDHGNTQEWLHFRALLGFLESAVQNGEDVLIWKMDDKHWPGSPLNRHE